MFSGSDRSARVGWSNCFGPPGLIRKANVNEKRSGARQAWASWVKSPYDFKTPEASAILTIQHGPQALRLRDLQLRELPLGTIHLHTD
jgi:hypothetical protein